MALTSKQFDNCLLVHGDCRKFIPTIERHSIDLVLTDPPYGISYQTNHRTVSKTPDVIDNDHSIELIADIFKGLRPKLSGLGSIYCFCSATNIEQVLPLVKAVYGSVKNLLVWDKQNWGCGDLYNAYGSQYEFIVYAAKAQGRPLAKRRGDILSFARVAQPGQVHPNHKPTTLLRYLIENTTPIGATVFDPCMGGGSCAVACVETGRKFIGCEINSNYFAAATKSVEWALVKRGKQIKKAVPIEIGRPL